MLDIDYMGRMLEHPNLSSMEFNLIKLAFEGGVCPICVSKILKENQALNANAPRVGD